MPIRVVEVSAVVLLLVVLLSAVLVLAIWPWMVFITPQGAASSRPADLIVVLDGGSSRLEHAEPPPAVGTIDPRKA